jgi:hypothetical protein
VILLMKKRKEGGLTLRQQAEELLKKNSSGSKLNLSETDLLRLIYELEVHQVELELQNEELRLAQAAAQNMAEKYLELYDFAPIGYLELTKEGSIAEINLCASQMLGKERSKLKKSQFGFFISDDTKPFYNLFLRKTFISDTKTTCVVTLSTNTPSPVYVRLIGITCKNKEQCLVTMTDITDQKRAKSELEKWAAIFKPKAN